MCCDVDCITIDQLTQRGAVAQINKPTIWLHQKNEDKIRRSVKASTALN